jgi:hypothetical protein
MLRRTDDNDVKSAESGAAGHVVGLLASWEVAMSGE